MKQLHWSVSPYPNGYDFAFSIVHDADDAYSLRLAPLFEVFDRYRFKVTVTAFAFWADWACGGKIWDSWKANDPFLSPRAVPLEDRAEREFYKSLVERGHELGLHTASDGDDTRERVIEAFEYFQAEFGSYPSVYVEHRNNKENHQFEGANPASPYFITDVLNRYRPWVWIVSPSALPYNGRGRYFDLLDSSWHFPGWFLARQWGTVKEFLKTGKWKKANGRLFETMLRACTPFDQYATYKYGLTKAFRRSGRRQQAGGDGFLQWYSDRNLDSLERENGLALVYTHLNTKWLDKSTGQMRPELQERIAAIASRNVWLAPASTILDRFQRLKRVHLVVHDTWVKVANGSGCRIEGLTLTAPPGVNIRKGNSVIQSNPRGKLVVGDLGPSETLVLEMVR